jgi:hypothetical protein
MGGIELLEKRLGIVRAVYDICFDYPTCNRAVPAMVAVICQQRRGGVPNR